MKKFIIFAFLFGCSQILGQKIEFDGSPELFLSGLVSTDKTEVKITFSPDGKLMLWGTIGWENGIGGWDIWQSEKTGDGWSKPRPASFNSKENDFDPCFSPDGKAVYFFSNRPGGHGGDDIYYSLYNPVTKAFSAPVNMGPDFNTKGDEWGPSFSSDGKKFIYCTNGFKGKGEHDIYLAEMMNKGWNKPENIENINFSGDDFDPVMLNNGVAILFTRKLSDDEAYLYISYFTKDGYSTPVLLGEEINIKWTWNFGSSFDPSDSSYIYYSTRNEKISKGRMDIYRIKYRLIPH